MRGAVIGPARVAAARDAIRAWVGTPSFSDTGEGIDRCAGLTRDLLSLVAPDAAVVPTAGHPVVLGTVRSRRPDAPTLIVYGLYDVTPTLAAEWRTDPLVLTEVDPPDLGLDPALGGLLVGRGITNHKGPVAAAVHAVRAVLDERGDLPAHLVFVIEGEEEIGSPHLPGFVARHRELLGAADGIWLPCFQQDAAGTLALRRAYKGALWVDLVCRGGAWGGPADGRHRWAGHSAWIDAPLMQLVRAVASLFDDRQRLTVAGLPAADPDDPRLAALLARFRSDPRIEAGLRRALGVTRFLGGAPPAEHLPHYALGTTINVQGVTGGYQGPGSYTMLPGAAAAKLDVRFPPGPTPAEVAVRLREHLAARGYDGVEVVPTGGYPGSPALPAAADTLLAAARRVAAAREVPVDVWPLANNCCPAALFTALGAAVPFSVAGLGHGDRPHAPDEYATAASIGALMDWTPDFLDAWARVVSGPGREVPGSGSSAPGSSAPGSSVPGSSGPAPGSGVAEVGAGVAEVGAAGMGGPVSRGPRPAR